MLLPALIVLSLFIFYPILWSLAASLKEATVMEFRQGRLWEVPGRLVGLQNYRSVGRDPLFWRALVNTLRYALLYIPFSLVSSLGLAIFLNIPFRGRHFLRTIIFTPYIISVVSSGVIFLALYRSDYGFLPNFFEALGFRRPSFLGEARIAIYSIAFMSSWRKLGYFMLIFLAGLQTIPPSLYEAARVDGATRRHTLWYITIPSLGRMISVVLILLVVDVLKAFQEVIVMTGGGPNNSTVTLPLLIYNEAFRFFRIGSAAAMSYILLTLALLVMGVQRFLRWKMEK